MNLQTDPLDNLLPTQPVEMGCEISIEPYPNCHFWWIDNHDCHFGEGSVPTQTRTQSDVPDPLITLCLAPHQIHRLPPSHLCSHMDYPTHHSSQANDQCRKYFQVHCLHPLLLDDSRFSLFCGLLVLEFIIQVGHLQTNLVAKVIFPTI